MSDDSYRVEIVQVGKMDEVPASAIYMLEQIGEYQPFCYAMLILRRHPRWRDCHHQYRLP